MSIDALILAGGRSTRMGRDKAWLTVDGKSLLARQVEKVRAAGCSEVYISGGHETDYSALGCPVLHDAFANAGPLAGIERGLAVGAAPMLLVLAVDLPAMSADVLRHLLAEVSGGIGVVPYHAGRPEPLAAVYPRAAHPWAVAALQAGRNAVHTFVDDCRTAGLVRAVPIAPAEVACFANWNSPTDRPNGAAAP